VRTAIAELKKHGLLQVLFRGTGRRSTIYKLTVVVQPAKGAARNEAEVEREPAGVAEAEWLQNGRVVAGTTPGVVAIAPPGDAKASTKPTNESSKEPPKREEPAAAPPASLSLGGSFESVLREGEEGAAAPTASSPTATVTAKAATKTKATPISADWTPSAEQRAYAAEVGLDPDAAARAFFAYWRARPDARKPCWNAEWVTSCGRYKGWGLHLAQRKERHWADEALGVTAEEALGPDPLGALLRSPVNLTPEQYEGKIKRVMNSLPGRPMPLPQDFWSTTEFMAAKKAWDKEDNERHAKARALVEAEDAVCRAAEERAAEAAREAAHAAAAAEGARGPVIDGEVEEVLAAA